MNPRPTVLGVPFDPLTQKEAIDRVCQMLNSPHQKHVMTPNAEMLVEGTKNPEFLRVMQAASLNLADSMGVVWFAHGLPERVTGIDTVTGLCASLSSERPVFFLGAAPGVAEKAAHALHMKNPQLEIAGAYAGSPAEEHAKQIIERVNSSGAHLLFVAYGAPKQDLWIHRHLKEMPHVRVAMGVGGTFDFLAGVQIRAPRLLRGLGLEWFWRLLQEPKRIGRIFAAVIVFPYLVITQKN